MHASDIGESIEFACPNCAGIGLFLFYAMDRVPVHSVLLHRVREEAIEIPRGDIRLGFCRSCGFITNAGFDPSLQNYRTEEYEATQAFSDTFNSFHRTLALRLIDQYDLHGKKIIEIGCGQGEFLRLLCDLGGNHGTGFDPAYRNEEGGPSDRGDFVIIKDYFSDKYFSHQADFICCKMTLEHIRDTRQFVSLVADSARNRPGTIIFFQVPNAQLVLHELAFWDIYYEHCSYFSPGSLSRLFHLCDLDVIHVSAEYDNQYLAIEARPGSGAGKSASNTDEYLPGLEQDLVYFTQNYRGAIHGWQERIRELRRAGKRIILWGGSSRTVSLLHALDLREEIEYVVDINPRKSGTFLAGTGHAVVSPDHLRKNKPDTVIVTNPIYAREVEQMLESKGIVSQVIPLLAVPA